MLNRYSHCIMGILNYPMALFCAIFMAHFARIAPLSTVSLAKNLWIGAWLALSSPLGLFAIANVVNPQGNHLVPALKRALSMVYRLVTGMHESCPAGAHDAVAFLADGFSNRINLLALPYACLLYVPVHVLSLAVWSFGTGGTSVDKHAKQD